MVIDWSGVCLPRRKAAVKRRQCSHCVWQCCVHLLMLECERKAGVSSWKKNPSKLLKSKWPLLPQDTIRHSAAVRRAWQGVCFPLLRFLCKFAADKALSQMNALSDLIQPPYTSVKELFCRCTSHLNESFSSKG